MILVNRALRIKQGFGLSLALILASALIGTMPVLAADATTAAVLYPRIKEPYNQVFANITEGIAENFKGEIKTFKFENDTNIAEIRFWIAENNISSLIALGSNGLKFARQLKDELPLVVGAVNIATEPTEFSGISMTPAPMLLLSQMARIVPNVSKVHVIYQKKKQAWLIGAALDAARQTGLSLIPHPVDDLLESAHNYRKLLTELNSDSEALWLISDNSIMDQAVMRDILEVAWQRKLYIFSNRLPDVKRGALFSMYPDNKALGSSLARMLMEKLQHPEHEEKIILLADLLTAINLRTAKHLGLYFNKSEQQDFELIYPMQ
ncbi:ABC transporter substrate binding protein [Shewanella salipaludis]|uniref:ABC transport system substrate-binding protein n=1 Tax=Shewanella salipaludis TaxID=2723052 RepID=A0A972FZV0_9GAMM|nr:ABC transporter substrate binding protein [Shewanella salipaludis]NMH64604.1 hypothetical protein [Shewanella salipaludis]